MKLLAAFVLGIVSGWAVQTVWIQEHLKHDSALRKTADKLKNACEVYPKKRAIPYRKWY